MKLRGFLRHRSDAIPLADAPQLRRQARRTLAVRLAIAALAVAALATGVSVSRDTAGDETQLFGGGESGVIVIDLSASIGASPHARIGRALRQLLAARTSFGLVVFADVAYEAVPPGTSSAELRPLLRFFRRLPARRSGYRMRRDFTPVPANPFTALRGGTRISTGLALARRVLIRERAREAGVLLMSDLDNSLFDMPALIRTLGDYERDGIPLRVLGLSPSDEDEQFFERVVGEEALVGSAELAPRRAEAAEPLAVTASAAFPTALVAAALLVLLLVAANEHWSVRLRWKDERA